MKNLILGVLLLLPFSVNASELDQTTITQTMMDNNDGLKLFIKAVGGAVRW